MNPASGDPDPNALLGAARLRTKLPWFALAAACAAADLWTKHIVFYPMREEGDLVADITNWWSIKIAYNQGVTFGLASGTSAWLLGVGTGLIIVVLLCNLWTARRHERAKHVSLAMIVGGALGNLYDRTLRPLVELDQRPGVRDFLDWYVPDDWALAGWLQDHGVANHWYTFNVADALIVCGVCVLAILILREKPEKDSGATKVTG